VPDEILKSIDLWGADHAAAAVVGPSALLASHGDSARRFEVASLTKLFSALAVLVAVEEGTISLDDKVGPPGSTLKHLLCHSSGLGFDTDQVLVAPGVKRIYSNTGYELAAQHLAVQAEMRFEQYLAEAVLQPLGMNSTSLDGSAAKDAVSSCADLCLLAQEMLLPTLIDHSTWSLATQPQFPDLAGIVPGWGPYTPCPWGLGPEIRGKKDPHWTGHTASSETYGHFGASGCFLWVDPTRKLACVAVTDREFGSWAIQVWPGFCDQVRASFR
jgi:CubicO group peptidase (beta-lactamase class C family)